ncbi:MAG: iron uptake protein [Parahaliea sp.]
MSTLITSSDKKEWPVRTLAILSRIAASLAGGYVFVWGASSLGIVTLVALGVDYDSAWTFCMLLAFLLYLTAFLWVWTVHRVLWAWLILAGGGGVMTAVALFVQQRLIAGA